VADESPHAADPAHGESGNGRLDSWKEIAAYLRRDVTTVRRWEKREGLPVHRHAHDRRDSVYAFRSEVDRWSSERRNHINGKPPADPANRRIRVVWPIVAALVMVALTGIGALVISVRPAAGDDRQLRFSIAPPDGASIGTLSLSPDGRLLAFTTVTRDGEALLWVRRLDSLTAMAVAGTEGAQFPFWSPDSRSIGFFAFGSLKQIDAAGGVPRIVCAAADGRGGTWSPAGTIVFAPGRESALFQVPARGGTPTPVTALDPAGERGHIWPQFLPDGRHFLYLADSARPEFHKLFAGSLDSMNGTRIAALASNAVYTRDGYLIFARDRALMAQQFDARRFTLSGEPITLAPQILQRWNMDHLGDFTVSDNGTLIYRSMQGSGSETQLAWRDREERLSPFVSTLADYYEPTLSPDGTRVAVDVFDPRQSRPQGFGTVKVTSDVWLVDSDTGAASQFTFHPAADFDPVWSPDGTRIAFSSNRGGVLDLYQKRVDGTGPEELLFGSPVDKHALAWSPDGRFLVFLAYDPDTRTDLWLLPLTGDRTPVPLLRTEAGEEQATISPDGRWFAYTSNESGRSEVYVRSFPSGDGLWRLSTGGGGDPRWRPDGREIFYIAEDRRLVSVSVKPGAVFEHGPPVPLFDTGMTPYWGAARNHYDIGSDGRFLFMVPAADDRTAPFTIVINWSAGLRR
jgi:Tol biopolymer transport system component